MALLDDWKAWRARPFPSGIAALDTGGVDVFSVDSFAAGCLTTYFDRGGLDEQRIGVLEECARDLHRVLPALSGDASEYFGDLAALCRGVLGVLGRRT